MRKSLSTQDPDYTVQINTIKNQIKEKNELLISNPDIPQDLRDQINQENQKISNELEMLKHTMLNYMITVHDCEESIY